MCRSWELQGLQMLHPAIVVRRKLDLSRNASGRLVRYVALIVLHAPHPTMIAFLP